MTTFPATTPRIITCTTLASEQLSHSIEDHGFAINEACMGAEFIQAACQAIEHVQNTARAKRRKDASYAMRNLLDAVPAIRQLVEKSALMNLMRELMGEGTFVTRAILFDKTGDANWAVPWHQDTTIAVQEKREAPGFGPWSIKQGVVHVQPPAQVLEGILTARIHLDDCDLSNGALKVIAGSHRSGILEHEQIAGIRETNPATICAVRAGGVLLMRPLLLHASSRAQRAAHRRVIHLEFACMPLPCNLQWNRA